MSTDKNAPNYEDTVSVIAQNICDDEDFQALYSNAPDDVLEQLDKAIEQYVEFHSTEEWEAMQKSYYKTTNHIPFIETIDEVLRVQRYKDHLSFLRTALAARKPDFERAAKAA